MKDAEEILNAKVNYVMETIPGNDWVNVVLDSFTPTKVIDGLWIVPEWCEVRGGHALSLYNPRRELYE